MNKIYKLVWSKIRNCYVVASELAKSHSKTAKRPLMSKTLVFAILLSFLQSMVFAESPVTVTGTQGDDELLVLKAGDGIGVDAQGNIVTISAEYDTVLDTLRNYVRFNADYNSGTSIPTVASNSANSFVWGKNAGVYVYSLSDSSEKNIAIGANAKIYAGNMANPSKNTGSNTAIGADSNVGSTNIYGTYSTVVGAGAKAYGASNVVVGNSQVGLNQQIGTQSNGTKIWANVDNSVAVGSGAYVYSDKGTAIGGAAIAGKKPTKTTYTDRSQAENAKNTYVTAVGYGAHAFGPSSTAVGAQTIATGQQNVSLGSGSEARKDNTMAVGFHAVASAADSTAIGHDTVTFGDGGIAIGHLVFNGVPANEGYRNNDLDQSYLQSPAGQKIAGDSKIYLRTEDGTVLRYEIKIDNNGVENGKYYKMKAVPDGTGWKFVKVNAAGEEVADNSPDAVQYLAKETMIKDVRTGGGAVNHVDYFYIEGQENTTKLYPLDGGVAIGRYISTEGTRSTAIGMSSTAHGSANAAIGLYTNTFGDSAVSIGHATLSGAQGHITTNANTGLHEISYKTLNNGIVERTTIDGTPVMFDKNFQYTVATDSGTVKIWNGKVIELGNSNYTQTGMKLASDNSAVSYDASGYLYYTKNGEKQLVESGENIIVSGSGGDITLPAGKMMLSNGGVSIGSYSHSAGDKALAIGVTSGAHGQNSVALGSFSNAYGKGSVAIGDNATAGAEVVEDSRGHHVLALNSDGLGTISLENGKPVENSFAIGTYAHASGNDAIALGINASALAHRTLSIGSESTVTGENSLAIGTGHIVTGNNSGAIGDPNIVNANNSYVVGNDSSVTAGSDNSFIIGNSSVVEDGASNSVLFGNSSVSSAENGVAVGNNTVVSGNNSVAIGEGSVADAENVVSVGSDSVTRNIVNVSAGVNDTDAVNVSQLNEALDNKANKDASNVAGNTADWGTAIGTGVIENGNGELVTGGTVFEETRVANDGNYILKNNTAGQNITALDTKVKSNADVIDEITAELDDKANVSLNNITDVGKNVIKSLVNVTGGSNVTVNKTNVSGVDTYTVNVNGLDDVKTHYVSINSTNQSSNSNYNNNGASGTDAIAIGAYASATGDNSVAIGYKSKAEGKGSFAFGENATADGTGSVAFTGWNEASGPYSMSWGFGNVAGISADGTEVYTAATAFGTGTEARNKGATAMGNWSIAEGENSVAIGNESHTHSDAKASLAMGQETHTLGSGSFAGGTDSIAGGFNSFAHGYTAEAVGDTAVALGNDAKAVGDESVALGYNSQAYGDYSVAILGGRTGDGTFNYNRRTEEYDVDVTDNAIGAIAAGYGSVAMKDYTVAIGRHAIVNNDKGIALGEDTNVSADNSAALGSEAVATEENVISVGHKQGDAKYGGGTYSEALNRKIVNVAAGVDDTDAVNVSQLSAIDDAKANVDLDNITDDGKNVIKTNAKEAINVTGSGKATVTKTDVSGVDTYTVDVTVDGQVVDGDTNIVTGGTVHTALLDETRPASDGNYIAQSGTAGANLTVLDTAVKTNADAIDALDTNKANISLDNITDAGKTVIQNATNVISGDDIINVTSATADGVKTYTVTANISADGQIVSGNTGLVSGGTVYNEVRPASDGNYIAVANTTGENLTALDTQMKANADAIVSNKTHFFGVNSTNEYDMNYNGGGATGTNAVAVGTGAWADSDNSIAIGNISATMFGENAVAIGNFATSLAENAVAVGASSQAPNSFATAVGSRAVASGWSSTAIGKNAFASGKNSIAVGSDSTATGEDEFSVGRPAIEANAETGQTAMPEVKRRITHVDTGVNDTDAVNVKQLTDLVDTKANVDLDNITSDGETVIKDLAKSSINVTGTNKAVVTKTDENGVDTYTVDVKADGTVAQGDENIVSGGTVYDALETAKSEISDALDTKANKDASNVSSNAEEWGTAIGTGAVDAADGKLVTGSTVAGETRVASDGNYITAANTAGQNITALDTQVKVNADAIEALGTDKANVSLDNITDAGKTVIQNATNVVSGDDNINVTSATADGVRTYTVSANFTTDGQVASGNTGLVSGGTVFNEVRPADGEYVSNSVTTGANLNALDNVVKSNKDAIDGLSDGKANISLDNINDDGKDVIQKIARDSVKVQGRNHITSELVYDADGNAVYRVEDIVDGLVVENNKGIVDGGTVFEAIKDAKDEVTDATDTKLQDYAKKDASNVSDAGAWGEKIATGSVSENEVRAVNGDTVYRALQDSEAATQRALDGKANVSLDNLNTDGKNVLQQSAITSVKVADGENTTVSSEYDADGNITYKVVANVTGTVTDGDTNIVSGGTVYSALKDLSDNTDVQLDTKANKDLDNISDDGKSVVRTLAQEAVKVVDGDNTTVVEGTDGNAKTYAVHAVTDGAITSGNTGIVTGGTVYDAIQDSKTKYFGVNATSAYTPNIDGSGATGSNSIAIGTSPMAMGDESVSIGTLSATMGEGAVAMGYMSTALSDGAVAVGPSSQAILENSTAIGNGAAAPYKNSVAIGAGSMATEENVFAVGAENKERRIVSVAAGTADTDAVNVSQLNMVSDGKADVDLGNITDDGKTVIKDNAKEAITVVGQDLATVTKTDENGVDTYTVSVKADGTVDSSDEKAVSGQTVFAETRVSADGNYVRQGNSSAQNLTALDTALKDVSDVANEAKDVLDSKANVDMDNLSDAGKTEVRTLAKEAVKVIDGTNTTVTEGTDGEAKTYAVNVVTDGRVESGDTGVVSGGTVYDALKTVTDDVADSLEGKADVNLRNIDTDGKTVIRNVARDAVQVQGDDHITSERVYDADGNSVYRLTAKTDGVVENNNTGLVSGGTVFDETRSSDGNYISKTNTAGENITALDDALKDVSDTVDETKEALDGKANTGLDNITPAGERVIKDLAKGSVTVKSGEYTNVVKSDEAGVDTYTVNTVVNGVVANGNTGIVTGGTVYDAIQDVVSDTSDALDTKANVSLDNLNTDGNRYLQQKAIQSVKVVDGENTTVTSSYDADGNISYAVKAVADGEIAQGNGKLVTGGTVYDALKSQSDIMTEELNKKANADASNVTDAQAWGEKIATGQIASGDVRAVSGDTVNALKTSVEEGLDNKANTSLDNITDNGKNVVRDLAKESISVVGDDDVIVTKQTAGNADEYSLSIRKNGTVASGDEALITGGTMFTELRPSDGNYVRNSYTTAGNLTALDAKLKETYDIAVAAGQTGTDENAVHYDGADKSVVTMAGVDGTKLTNLKDGEVSQNSKDAVTGGQLYQVKQDVAANTQAIDTLSDKVGDTADGTYVQSANSVGQNLNALDSQVKSNTDAISSLTEGMNGKADTDLSNLSDAGKDNVKNIAKESVEVVSSDNSVLVTKTDTDTLRTFDLSVNKDGKIEEGNNGIVTGGTVYNAIQDIQVSVDDVEEKLDGKMNKDMSNITEDGKEVIRETLKPELDKKANTDASNIDVDTWSDKLGVGKVVEGDNGLVKGDTVYRAIQNSKGDIVVAEGDTFRVGGNVKYDGVDMIDVSKSDGTGRIVRGVMTDTSDDTSAANVGYVKAVGETIIDGVNAGLHKIDDKVNKVGAGAAALASIAPMPFDEDRRWTVAAAIGTYRGEQAGAIGAFYKPSDNIMFNVRGVIGNGENMAGAGITIGLDKRNANGLSKVAMAKVINAQAQEIQAQKAELEAQKAEIQQLKEMVQKIASK